MQVMSTTTVQAIVVYMVSNWLLMIYIDLVFELYVQQQQAIKIIMCLYDFVVGDQFTLNIGKINGSINKCRCYDVLSIQ